jgi:hypothetical protein
MSREGTDSEHVLESLVAHRPIDPGSKRRLHRHRYEHIVHGRFTRETTAAGRSCNRKSIANRASLWLQEKSVHPSEEISAICPFPRLL